MIVKEAIRCSCDICISRFRPVIVKEAIHQVLMETLQGKDYNSEECTDLTKSLSDQIKAKLRGQQIIVYIQCNLS